MYGVNRPHSTREINDVRTTTEVSMADAVSPELDSGALLVA